MAAATASRGPILGEYTDRYCQQRELKRVAIDFMAVTSTAANRKRKYYVWGIPMKGAD